MSLFNYELKGEWDPACKEYVDAEQKEFNENPDFKITLETLPMIREFAQGYWQGTDGPEYKKFIDQCENEEITIDGSKYGSDNAELKLIVQRLAGKPKEGRPCLLYFHGGGGFMMSASNYLPISSRIAVECDVTLVQVDYRLAPEAKAPGSIMDCYAATKYVIENAEALGVDKSKIAISGESSGGYLATGVGMKLAEKDESNLVKLCFPIIPMTSDYFVRTPESEMPAFEKSYAPSQLASFEFLAKDQEAQKKDKDIFPNLMGDELAAKMPPSVVFTSEFDFFRIGSEELMELLKKNGKLLDSCIHPGGHHGFFIRYHFGITDGFYSDVAKVVDKYLKN